jgi:hypothetical protein
MDWQESIAEVERVLGALQDAQAKSTGDIENGLKLGDRLRDAARSIAESSSGSWIGWHSRMYYGNYEAPTVQESWDSGWGGINPIPPAWHERSLREVQREIESRAGLSLADVGKIADRVREACQPLQRELITVLSPMCDLAGLAKEAELLDKLEKVEWIVPPADYIRALAPTSLWSRDTHALSQGMQAPLHLEVEAAIVSNTSTLATSRDFLIDAIRLARQVRTKLKAMPPAVPVENPMLGRAVDGQVQRQLRQRSRVLFALLALAVLASDLWLVRKFGHDRLRAAALMLVGALAVGGAYAWLLERAHVRWALAWGGGVLAALAALDQILGHFLP